MQWLTATPDGLNSAVIIEETLGKICDFRKTIICERKNGYGLNKMYYDQMLEFGVKIVVTADIGVTGVEEVEYGKTLGIQTIVTDHHPIQSSLAPTCPIVNPKWGDTYWYNLCGAGLIYVLMRKLYTSMRKGKIFDTRLVALDHAIVGTIGDLVPLVGVNRLLIAERLPKLKEETNSLGLEMLLSNAFDDKVSTSTISFGVVPFINSMNRIGNIYQVLDFFTVKHYETREALFKVIVENNETRKTIQADAVEMAKKYIRDNSLEEEQMIMAVINAPSSVCGLVSSYITQSKYGVPSVTVALSKDGTTYGGSGRGCGAFNGLDLVQLLKPHCIKIGGHAMAFGLSFKKEKLHTIQKLIREFSDGKTEFDNEIELDEIVEFKDLTRKFQNDIQYCAPYGMANPEPIFGTSGVRILHIDCNGRHSFIEFEEDKEDSWDNESIAINANLFFTNVDEDNYQPGEIVNIAYTMTADGVMNVDKMWRP